MVFCQQRGRKELKLLTNPQNGGKDCFLRLGILFGKLIPSMNTLPFWTFTKTTTVTLFLKYFHSRTFYHLSTFLRPMLCQSNFNFNLYLYNILDAVTCNKFIIIFKLKKVADSTKTSIFLQFLSQCQLFNNF